MLLAGWQKREHLASKYEPVISFEQPENENQAEQPAKSATSVK